VSRAEEIGKRRPVFERHNARTHDLGIARKVKDHRRKETFYYELKRQLQKKTFQRNSRPSAGMGAFNVNLASNYRDATA